MGDRVLVEYQMDGEPVQKLGELAGREPYPGPGNTDMTRDPGYEAWGIKGKLNPKIILDDGTVIWGCECWWWRTGGNI